MEDNLFFNFSILQFSLIYVFLTVLLLIMIIYSRAPIFLKSIPIIVSIFFLIGSYITIDGLLGRPAKIMLPNEFFYVHHISEAPIKAKNDPGRILVMLEDDIGYRLHEIPYSQEARKKLEGAKEQSRGGKFKVKMRTTDEEDEIQTSPFSIMQNNIYEPHKWKIMNDIVAPPSKENE